MPIQNRNYFFLPTPNTERFLSQDEPTEQVMRDFLDSIAFKVEVSDTATETQQGLTETATQAEFDNGTDNNANGFALYVRPSMIKNAIAAVVNLFQPIIDAIQQDILNIQNDITTIQGDITNIQNQFGEEMPLGSILMYPTSAPPNSKWLICDGQTLNTTLYPDLFALIGYSFGGAGNSFSLPDMRKKFFAGFDDNGPAEYQTIGQGGGANSVTLTGAQSGIADHNHGGVTGGDGAHTHTFTLNKRDPNVGGSTIAALWLDKGDNQGVQAYPGFEGTTMSDPGNHTHTISASGDVAASEAHENRPEFIVFPFMMKVLN